MQRPLGVTILALWDFACTGYASLLAIVAMIGPGVLVAVLRAVGSTHTSLDPEHYNFGIRLILAFVFLGLAVLGYIFGKGLWRLRNWSRVLSILFSAIDLVFGRPYAPTTFWHVLHRIIAVVVLVYLLRPRVRDAFKRSTTLRSQTA